MQFIRNYIWGIERFIQRDYECRTDSDGINRKLFRYVYRNKGSLTVEASIALPVFLSFFLIVLYIMKLALFNILLDHSVNETARQLAAASYPLSFLNEFEDEMIAETSDGFPSFEDELKNAAGYLYENVKESFPSALADLLSGNDGAENAVDVLYNTLLDVCNDYKKSINGYLVKEYADKYYSYKSKAKYAAASLLLEKQLSNTILNKKNINIVMVNLPQSNTENEARCRDTSYIKACESLNIIPDPDDVVVAVEYKMSISLPFLGSKQITTRHVAVEKAWMYGSRGVYNEEKSDIYDDATGDENNGGSPWSLKRDTVYVTRTGVKYHSANCRYLAKSRIPVSRSEALARGYKPCKVCNPG